MYTRNTGFQTARVFLRILRRLWSPADYKAHLEGEGKIGEEVRVFTTMKFLFPKLEIHGVEKFGFKCTQIVLEEFYYGVLMSTLSGLQNPWPTASMVRHWFRVPAGQSQPVRSTRFRQLAEILAKHRGFGFQSLKIGPQLPMGALWTNPCSVTSCLAESKCWMCNPPNKMCKTFYGIPRPSSCGAVTFLRTSPAGLKCFRLWFNP